MKKSYFELGCLGLGECEVDGVVREEAVTMVKYWLNEAAELTSLVVKEGDLLTSSLRQIIACLNNIISLIKSFRRNLKLN